MSERASERKRVFAALLGGVLAVSLASCGSDTLTPPPPPTPPPAAHAAVTLERGLADLNYRSQLTAQVPFGTFTDINVSFTAMLLPSPRVELR